MSLKIEIQEGVTQYCTPPVYQYGKGNKLSIRGTTLEFPMNLTISNRPNKGNGITYSVDIYPIPIPDEFFLNGRPVYLWFYDPTYMTECMITIPIVERPVPVPAVFPFGPDSGESDNQGTTYTYYEDDENLMISGGSNENNTGGE